MKKVIHISQSLLKSAQRSKQKLPVIVVKCDRSVRYCQSLKILGESEIVPEFDEETGKYSVWIETDSPVITDGKEID